MTQDEFDQLRCNGCGACCERFWLSMTPADMVGATGRRFIDDDWFQWLDLIEDRPESGGGWYSCRKFLRLSPDVGVCVDHDNRPEVCRGFPYGMPVQADTYPDCAFAVGKISKNDSAMGVERQTTGG